MRPRSGASLGGVSGGVGITALYRGLAVGRMGVVAPVTGVLAALIPVVAGIVLEGVPSSLAMVGIVLAIVAVVLVSRVSDASSGPSGLRFALDRRARDRPVQRLRRSSQRRPCVRAAGRDPSRRGGSSVGLVVLVTGAAWRPERRFMPAMAGVGVLDMAGNGVLHPGRPGRGAGGRRRSCRRSIR